MHTSVTRSCTHQSQGNAHISHKVMHKSVNQKMKTGQYITAAQTSDPPYPSGVFQDNFTLYVLSLKGTKTLSSRRVSPLLVLTNNYTNYLPTINTSSQPTIFADDTSVTLSSNYRDYNTTANIVHSLIITQPTNALIVCNLFLNHFFKTLSLLLHVSIAYRLS